jgi:hypothetical protein
VTPAPPYSHLRSRSRASPPLSAQQQGWIGPEGRVLVLGVALAPTPVQSMAPVPVRAEAVHPHKALPQPPVTGSATTPGAAAAPLAPVDTGSSAWQARGRQGRSNEVGARSRGALNGPLPSVTPEVRAGAPRLSRTPPRQAAHCPPARAAASCEVQCVPSSSKPPARCPVRAAWHRPCSPTPPRLAATPCVRSARALCLCVCVCDCMRGRYVGQTKSVTITYGKAESVPSQGPHYSGSTCSSTDDSRYHSTTTTSERESIQPTQTADAHATTREAASAKPAAPAAPATTREAAPAAPAKPVAPAATVALVKPVAALMPSPPSSSPSPPQPAAGARDLPAVSSPRARRLRVTVPAEAGRGSPAAPALSQPDQARVAADPLAPARARWEWCRQQLAGMGLAFVASVRRASHDTAPDRSPRDAVAAVRVSGWMGGWMDG